MEISYSSDKRIATVDGINFRRDMKTGYYLAAKPTFNGKRERLHVYMWRTRNGEIPDGFHVHHKTEDKGKNEIGDLSCIPCSLHLSHHSKERAANNYDEIIKNLNESALPKAAEWHKSAAGREWHKAHYKKTKEALYRKEQHKCEYCGKEYLSSKAGTKYCSNNCKAAARRLSGVDNEKRTCIICGAEFFANKYTKSKTCSRKCSGLLHSISNEKKRLLFESKEIKA